MLQLPPDKAWATLSPGRHGAHAQQMRLLMQERHMRIPSYVGSMSMACAHQVSISSCRAVVQRISHRHCALTAAGKVGAASWATDMHKSKGLYKSNSDCILRGALTHARSNANGQVGKRSHDEAGNARGSGCGCDERLLSGCLQAAVRPTSARAIPPPRGFCRPRLRLDRLPAGLQLCTVLQSQPDSC